MNTATAPRFDVAAPEAPADVTHAHVALARGSKSFALAGRLLGGRARDDAAVVYAYCRRADDAVDLVPAEDAPRAVARLRQELASVYAGEPQHDPVLRSFQEVVRRRRIPMAYPLELIEGFAMDARGTRYDTRVALLLYCHRVAGVVGLMMAHVLGVKRDAALRNAAHLGIAMQLTNIARDVAEDWERGRIYVPDELLGAFRGVMPRGKPPVALRPVLAAAVRTLLNDAEGYYRSGASGLSALPYRASVAIRTARRVYREIGRVLARRGYDALSGRAVVSRGRKLWLVLCALAESFLEWPARLASRVRARPPERLMTFEEVMR